MDLENQISRELALGLGNPVSRVYVGQDARCDLCRDRIAKPLNYACVTVVLDNQDGFIQQAGKEFASNGIFIVREIVSTRSMVRKYVSEMCMICSWILDWDVILLDYLSRTGRGDL